MFSGSKTSCAGCTRAWSGSSATCAPRSPQCTRRTSARSCSTGPRPRLPPGGYDVDFNKLTLKSQEAVAAAQELARRTGNAELTPDHLTVALLDQELPRTLADRAGHPAAELRAQADARIRNLPTVSGGAAQPQASAAFRRVLDQAFEEAQSLGDEFVSV